MKALNTLLAVAIAVATPAFAQMSHAQEGLYRIDLAGSMRMRSQRILRNACYVASTLNVDTHRDAVNADITALQDAQRILTEGDEALGIGAERSPTINHEFDDRLAPLMERFTLVPLYVAGRGAAVDDEMDQIADRSWQVVTQVNTIVGMLEEKYSRSSTVPPAQSRTLNVIGRQRMLSQRIAGQHCMVAQSSTPELRSEQLAETYALFQSSFADLLSGNFDNRIVEPTEATAEALNCAYATFEEMSPFIEAAIAGNAPTVEDMAEVADLSSTLLRQSQAVVQIARAEFASEPHDGVSCDIGT